MDVDKLKKGDYVVYTNETTNYYAIARFIQKDYGYHGVYLNAGKYGGFNGKKDIEMATVKAANRIVKFIFNEE